jgi:hypothetical protein
MFQRHVSHGANLDVAPNKIGVPPALPGRHPKFDKSGSPSKKLLA